MRSANILQSAAKDSKTTNPKHFHSKCFFFKLDLTLAKNKAASYAIKLIMLN